MVFKFSTGAVDRGMGQDCDIVFLATPNSVTGQLIPKTEIESIARVALTRKTFCRHRRSFHRLCRSGICQNAGARKSLPNRVALAYKVLSPCRDFGSAICSAKPAESLQLAAYQEPWSINGPALNVALACLKDSTFATKTKRWLEQERKFLFKRLTALEGLHPLASRTNFLLVKIERSHGDALQLRSFLLQRSILIRACDTFGLGVNYFRIAIKRRKDNQRLLAALTEWTSSIG